MGFTNEDKGMLLKYNMNRGEPSMEHWGMLDMTSDPPVETPSLTHGGYGQT